MCEYHPYGEFIPKNTRAIIIGSFPIGKFTNPKRRKEIKEHEIDFFFGGEKNLLWKLIGEVYGTKLSSKEEIVDFLTNKRIGVGDVIRSCKRKNGGASDADLYEIEWNHELLQVLHEHKIRKILFTSRKVEGWFHRLFPNTNKILTFTLISPSAQSVRSLPKREDFQAWLRKNKDLSKSQFILEQYRTTFKLAGL